MEAVSCKKMVVAWAPDGSLSGIEYEEASKTYQGEWTFVPDALAKQAPALLAAVRLAKRALDLRLQLEGQHSSHATLDPVTVVRAEIAARSALDRCEESEDRRQADGLEPPTLIVFISAARAALLKRRQMDGREPEPAPGAKPTALAVRRAEDKAWRVIQIIEEGEEKL